MAKVAKLAKLGETMAKLKLIKKHHRNAGETHKTILRGRTQDNPTRTNARPPHEDERKTPHEDERKTPHEDERKIIPQGRTQNHPTRTHTKKLKKQEIKEKTLVNSRQRKIKEKKTHQTSYSKKTLTTHLETHKSTLQERVQNHPRRCTQETRPPNKNAEETKKKSVS
ncbi:hypothetical protein C2G38_2192961 [Gigaspora rosea]|uniref:Uncharacterized protein n=1 Tax=Gigaspora rosea TaxID=44941 RepID=A0A397UYG7_9GLOM|nr:hypothetical protein C2G38_2192961 [Gigaspora rosea]